ncbi:hypothetical protein [Paenibacillus herberti]|uniref:DUF2178 domain-containing protein n=1 Tax=Paenibacillus herberti TaxID=1619309 RepID=A0A229NZC5_9BACL|nr:hypothetical protein [Paenibacillus herberti]OXM15045.1 hypothetical protein CGZ75_13040 [Paenibacillus herberti]
MNTRKIASILLCVAALVVIAFTIYKLNIGKQVGLNEVISISTLVMMYFSTITWGSKHNKDGILQEEELGQRITEKSSKIGYLILVVLILGAVALDELINNNVNVFLLALLGLSMILLPMIEFLYSRKYR